MNDTEFITPRRYARERSMGMYSDRGHLLIASCHSGTGLAQQIVAHYQHLLNDNGDGTNLVFLPDVDTSFSDTETCARLHHHVSGYDAFLVQSLYDPVGGPDVDGSYMAFLVAARALREHGARHITGILPYLAYARQDKPTRFTREPTTARLLADMSIAAGIDRLVVWHPHSPQIEGFYGTTTVNMLEPHAFFTEQFSRLRNSDETVLVAPDAGAAKMATAVARSLRIGAAITAKYRPSPERVDTAEVIGDLRGKRRAVILDDIVSSGSTLRLVIERVVELSEVREVLIGASHNLCTDSAYELFKGLSQRGLLRQFITTDSIPQTPRFDRLPCFTVVSLADRLARVVNRIHYSSSVSEVFASPS